MEKEQRRFNQKYNQAIIQLIRHKLSPLQKRKKHAIVPGTPKVSKSAYFKTPNLSFPSLPSSKITNLQTDKQNQEVGLLQKVKYYLQNKRRQNHLPDQKNQLDGYIQIFEQPISHKDRQKRQSIELNFFQAQRKQRPDDKQFIGFMEKDIDLTEEQRSILNAKMRRKLNHKKIVDLYRRI